MTEVWLPVQGHEGFYEVSDLGRVRSASRRLADGRRMAGRVRKLTPDRGGYLHLNLSVDGRRKTALVHRLVLEAFHGTCPPGLEARHLNGRNTDNRAVNLEWATHAVNNRDRVRHGTHQHARKTHCIRGHLFPPVNAQGKRPCAPCSAERYQERKRTPHA